MKVAAKDDHDDEVGGNITRKLGLFYFGLSHWLGMGRLSFLLGFNHCIIFYYALFIYHVMIDMLCMLIQRKSPLRAELLKFEQTMR